MIGNGRLGATIHGYTDKELIRLNEESIWSGGPEDRINPKAGASLALIRQQLENEWIYWAGNNWLFNFSGIPPTERAYQPAGELRIDFPHPTVSNYNRTLDISTGLSTVSYAVNGTTYQRQAIANAPTNVLAFHFKASRAGALNFDIGLTRDQNVTNVSADATSLLLTLKGIGSVDDTYAFTSQAKIVLNGKDSRYIHAVLTTSGGNATSNGTALKITGATEAYVYYDAQSAFRGDGYESTVSSTLSNAVSQGWGTLLSEAISDYQSYFNRSSVDFGDSGSAGQQSTPARQTAFKANGTDPELMALGYNMGKYLLISSSRPGTLPANLQGLWNKDFKPPWDSKFTLDINLQMNYWLAQPNDLAEISFPVFDFLQRMRKTGAEVASRMYNSVGWSCHHETDITADCAPYSTFTIDSPFPLAGAWLTFEMMEYYRFSGNDSWAISTGLPTIKESLQFMRNYTYLKDGYLVTGPSCSPENSYNIPIDYPDYGLDSGLDRGPMVDRSIMWEVANGFIEISKAVGSMDYINETMEFMSKIRGPVASPTTGRLMEWSVDFPEQHPDHQHFSPLVCVHPGTWVSPLNNETATNMSKALFDWRMSFSTSAGVGWSQAWATALYARFFDAVNATQRAFNVVGNWLWPNFLGKNGRYLQVDANLGLTAALVEMMIQSHAGVLHLGPALPTYGITNGSFTGLMARGGFKVDMTWENGAVTGANIHSLLGSPLKLRVQNGRAFKLGGAQHTTMTTAMSTTKGQNYTITF